MCYRATLPDRGSAALVGAPPAPVSSSTMRSPLPTGQTILRWPTSSASSSATESRAARADKPRRGRGVTSARCRRTVRSPSPRTRAVSWCRWSARRAGGSSATRATSSPRRDSRLPAAGARARDARRSHVISRRSGDTRAEGLRGAGSRERAGRRRRLRSIRGRASPTSSGATLRLCRLGQGAARRRQGLLGLRGRGIAGEAVRAPGGSGAGERPAPHRARPGGVRTRAPPDRQRVACRTLRVRPDRCGAREPRGPARGDVAACQRGHPGGLPAGVQSGPPPRPRRAPSPRPSRRRCRPGG